MELFGYLRSRSRFFYFILFSLGVIKSLTSTGMLVLISMSLAGRSAFDLGNYNYVLYAGLVLVSFFSTILFQNFMIKATNDIMFELELSIIEKVRNASYESFEKLGTQNIYSVIADTRSLSRAPEFLVTLANSIITILCSLAYLFWLSFWGGVIVLLLIAAQTSFYIYQDKRIAKELQRVRDMQDGFYRSLRDLLGGFKQMRVSLVRNNSFFHKHILPNREASRAINISSSKSYLFNGLFGMYGWYILLGVVIFILPVAFRIDIHQLAALIACVLFIISPISQLTTILSTYSSLKIALSRIEKVNKQLEAWPVQPIGKKGGADDEFESVRFENLQYCYHTEEKGSFSIDLDELTIEKGEILFIVGGNGSGKTTFINLLSGLYKPDSGKVFLNGGETDWDNYRAYNDRMAVVFADHYLFNENYDEYDISENNPQFSYLRKLVNLEGLLKVDEQKGTPDIRLSKGQQKRLALLLALMEHKPIIILDEWAAEQDPYNRKYFYTKLLEMMRHMGKTIIAISHDDDYYHLADRVLKFDYGKIVSEEVNARKVIQSDVQ